MDTIRHSDRFSTSIEINGPFVEYENLVSSLGDLHPYAFEETDTLHYYDGPIVAIGFVPGDARPRLDVLIDDDRTGDDGEHMYVSTRHQLVFDRLETLEATLSRDGVPTVESYRMADEILRYRSLCTQTGHPSPSHSMITSALNWEDIPQSELPYDTQVPKGMPTPSTTPRTES